MLINRDSAIKKVADKIERQLTLIGVTAIENQLQDGVSRMCIVCDLHEIYYLYQTINDFMYTYKLLNLFQ